MCLGACASLAVSCCSFCACKVCCTVGRLQSTGTRLCYAFLLFLTFFIALAMLGTNVQHWVNENLAAKVWFSDENSQYITDDLVGAMAVNRVMSASVAFHVLMIPLTVGVESTRNTRAALHNGLWSLKILGWLGLIVAMFFLPNEVFTTLSSTVYRIGGCLFVLYQLIQLIDFVFRFYATVYLDRGDPDSEGGAWFCLATVITLLSYGWVLFVAVVAIVVHADTDAGCAEGLVAVGLGFVLCLVVSALSVSGFVRGAKNTPKAHTNGIFQTSVVSAYCSYLVLSSLINHPEDRCRPVKGNDADIAVRMFGVLFTFISISYFAIKERYADLEDHTATAGPAAGGNVDVEGGAEGELHDDEQDRVKCATGLHSSTSLPFHPPPSLSFFVCELALIVVLVVRGA